MLPPAAKRVKKSRSRAALRGNPSSIHGGPMPNAHHEDDQSRAFAIIANTDVNASRWIAAGLLLTCWRPALEHDHA
jgi:hypothetical protein